MKTYNFFVFAALLILQTTSCKEKHINECENYGTWSESECECLPPYFGPLCEHIDSCLIDVPKSCNGFSCEAGKCNCGLGWTGNNCELFNLSYIEGEYTVIETIFSRSNQTNISSPLHQLKISNFKPGPNSHSCRIDYFHLPPDNFSGSNDIILKLDPTLPNLESIQFTFNAEHQHMPIPQFEFNCIWFNDTLYCDGIYFQRPAGFGCFQTKDKVEKAKFIAVKQK